MMRAVLRGVLLIASITVATPGLAAYAFTARDANVRAGPEREYPLVAWLPVGSVVEVMSCTPDFRWCDVRWEAGRGYVYAGLLGYVYGDGWVVVRDAGPYLGLPVLGFNVQYYWTTWYWDRPWYPQWPAWSARPPHYRPPPPMHRPPTVIPGPPIVGPAPAGAVPRMGNPVPRLIPPPQRSPAPAPDLRTEPPEPREPRRP
jgi:uncharacterized protein YraI